MFTCVLGREVHSIVLSVPKPQALVYDILPSTTAAFSYAIGSRKLSANEQFFVSVQTVVTQSNFRYQKSTEKVPIWYN